MRQTDGEDAPGSCVEYVIVTTIHLYSERCVTGRFIRVGRIDRREAGGNWALACWGGYNLVVHLSKRNAESLLKASRLRRTPVRLRVLDLLLRRREPLDAPQILEGLPNGGDLVTIYRTLNTFTRKKLVHRVRGDGRSWRFALGDAPEMSNHVHPHFVCDDCGRVECLEHADVPSQFVRSMRVGKGYKVMRSEVVLHGTCPLCAK